MGGGESSPRSQLEKLIEAVKGLDMDDVRTQLAVQQREGAPGQA